jgi:hypothetical protein
MMVKAIALAVLVLGQAAVLLAAGAVTLWWSQDLMLLLIHLVGEEWALGSGNVIRNADGSKLLTNPVGMIRWTLPFLGVGLVQITSAVTLVRLWFRKATKRSNGSELPLRPS